MVNRPGQQVLHDVVQRGDAHTSGKQHKVSAGRRPRRWQQTSLRRVRHELQTGLELAVHKGAAPGAARFFHDDFRVNGLGSLDQRVRPRQNRVATREAERHKPPRNVAPVVEIFPGIEGDTHSLGAEPVHVLDGDVRWCSHGRVDHGTKDSKTGSDHGRQRRQGDHRGA